MRLLAIDYGAKRVGVASTDESGEFALPRVVLPNDAHLLDEILKLVREGEVQKVIIGESKNLKGEHNPIFLDIQKFVQKLQDQNIEVILHPEMYTSIEADRLQGKTDMRDASAAALILKSYIDTKHNS